MPLGLIVFVAWMMFMVITTAAFFYWGWKEGQFNDIEEPKYRMMIDRELAPWPGREKPGGKPGEAPTNTEGGEHGRNRA